MDGIAQRYTQTRAIKTATQQKRRWICDLNITRWSFNVALCLTVLLNMDAASAAAWTLRRRKWLADAYEPQRHRETVLQRALEDAILAVSASYCASWTDPAVAALGKSALKAATKAARDKRVRDWVARRNAEHGAAVASEAVVRAWNGETAHLAIMAGGVENIRVAREGVTPRVWCHRWRRRCGAKITFLRTKEPLALETKREKAEPRVEFL